MLIGSVRIYLDEINFFVLDTETHMSVWYHTDFYLRHYQLVLYTNEAVFIIRIEELSPDRQPELKEMGLEVLAEAHATGSGYIAIDENDRWAKVLHSISLHVDATYYYLGDYNYPSNIAMQIMRPTKVIFVVVELHDGEFSEEQIAEELAAALRIEPVGMSD